MINENIKKLQTIMKDNAIDLYIIPTSDFHQSEYVGEYFGCRKFMSGFTGSAGTMIVTLDEAYLWVDGRYHIQAEKQLQNTNIILMKLGLQGVDNVQQFLSNHQQETIGFDGRVMSYNSVKDLSNKIIASLDLVDMVWHDRPNISTNEIVDYDVKYAGESRSSKLQRLRDELGDFNHHIITSLDDIAYLFNLRGSDVACNPVFNSYALINKDDAYLYVNEGTISPDLQKELLKDNIIIKNYDEIYEDVKDLFGNVVLDGNVVNYAIYKNINFNSKIIDKENPTQYFKCIKNDIEVKNTKIAHLKDGIAETKFMYWLKHTKDDLSEISISDKLEEFRSQSENFKGLSFDTICAYQENGALMHYKANPDNYSKVKREGLLLIDSGGQYLEGTTDITRTFVLGDITKEQAKDFTIALKAMFNLQNAVFLEGLRGPNLDILARGEVYKYNLDYRCGTGHGVGHYLNVHEGPNGFRPQDRLPEVMCAFKENMITTDEPGIYKEGKYGIRHENELLCVSKETNEYGHFLAFEPITYVPFDIAGLDFDLLSNHEIKMINDYQEFVYSKIGSYLTKQEQDWYQELYIK